MRAVSTLLACAFACAPLHTAYAKAAPKKAATRDRDAAIALFQQSRKAYRAGRFEEAANLLRRAYALDPAPTLLYNLARALESNGDIDGAADAYRRYLEADPSTEDRAAIERRISNLDAQIKEREELRRRLEAERKRREAAQNKPAPSPAGVAVSAPAPEPASGPSAVPWVVAGVGGASLVAGAVLGGLASSEHSKAEDATSMLDAVDADDRARGLARGANIAYGAGAALATAGLVWGLIDVLSDDGPDKPPEDDDGWSLAPAISPNGISVLGRF